ncbi:DUF2637 domain-containing protein [Bifidobacterium breve]|uniref:DUF2637 domain-containing protein n=1 Tax=Bifidobacterium breve TaxID=1685 RepID=UPI000E36A29D|nr:DUF2637 domain-containing protein [Bifidobacterium breve]RDX29845.1 hypothetical protein CE167_09715 [Bifidobacterium breve]
MWPGVTVAVILALLAFIISFDALRAVGLACGINGSLAWMFPIIIDGSTLAFTWAAWAFKTRRLSTVYPWLMLVLFSVISLIGNALHAHPVMVNGLLLPVWVPPVIMTVPPVALLATTHMIVLAAGRSFDNDDMEWESDHATPATPSAIMPETPPDALAADAPAPAPGPVEAPVPETATVGEEPAGPPVPDPPAIAPGPEPENGETSDPAGDAEPLARRWARRMDGSEGTLEDILLGDHAGERATAG